MAIISVIGSITVALITKWPFHSSVSKPTSVDTMIIPPKPDPDDLSFCDKLKLAIADVQQNFVNFKGPIVSNSEYEIKYQSNYVFDNTESSISYEKDEKTYTLELILYNGKDSIKATNVTNSFIAILDACLTIKNKQKLIDNYDNSGRMGHMLIQDYLSEDYEVELLTTLKDSSEVFIFIGKNDE